MSGLVETALAAVTQLGLYSLLALSLALVFGTSRMVNLAVGDLATVGAYAMVLNAGLPFPLRIVVTLVALAPVLYVLERSLLGRVRDPLAGLLVTWGVGLAIRQVVELVYTARPRSVEAPLSGSLSLLGAVYPGYRLLIAGIGLAVVLAGLAVTYRTRLGLRLRAVSDNPEMAALLGTPPGRTRALAFAVAGLLAVLAGALYSPLLGVTPSMGFALLIPGFVAILLARPASFNGAVLAVASVVVVQVALRRVFSDTVADSVFYMLVLAAVVVRSNPHIRRVLPWLTRTVRVPRRSAA